MADALTGLTEVDSTIEDLVSMRVQQTLIAEMVVWPLMTDYSEGVGKGMDTVKIPRTAGFSVSSKSENTAADASLNAFSTDDLALSKYKYVQFLVEDIASLQSKVNVEAQYLDDAAKALAADEFCLVA